MGVQQVQGVLSQDQGFGADLVRSVTQGIEQATVYDAIAAADSHFPDL
jgi:hypothetical protein